MKLEISLGKLTWEQARALVAKAYQPAADLHPSIRPIKGSPVATEDSDFARDFLQKIRQRLKARTDHNG
jgi:hypothetical protein